VFWKGRGERSSRGGKKKVEKNSQGEIGRGAFDALNIFYLSMMMRRGPSVRVRKASARTAREMRAKREGGVRQEQRVRRALGN